MDLEKLKVKIIISNPFFGSLLHKLEHVKSDKIHGNPLPTAATDGETIYYNEKFMDSLTTDQQIFVMCHEILHAAFLHIPRFTSLSNNLKEEDAKVFNIAADFLINDLLVNDMKMSMVKGGCLEDKYKFNDWTTEKLYYHFKKNMKIIKVELAAEGGAGSGNDMKPGRNMSDSEKKKNEADWQIAINTAAQLAKKQGNLPDSLERLIDKLLAPKIDWKKELFDWMSAKVITENTWNKGNRRFVYQDIYLPSKFSDGIGEIVVGIDTSGSIGQQELTMFASELNYILEFVKPTKVTVVYCDAAVNKIVEYLPDNLPIKFEAVGGGGTDFRPVFNWVHKHKTEEIAGLIYMTDMYGNFPEKAPDYPVAWMATSKTKPPFGKYIEYPFGENA